MTVAYPHDLALVVGSRLRRSHRPVSLSGLEAILETLYLVSLETEEGRPVRTSVFFIDRRRPNPVRLAGIAADHWKYTRLAQPLAFTPEVVSKLALAVDPTISAMAVDLDGSRPVLWGLIDQAPHRFGRFISLEADTGPEMPGEFQVSIVGPASLSVRAGHRLIAELSRNALRTRFMDAISEGPLSKALRVHAAEWLEKVRPGLPHGHGASRREWDGALIQLWLESLKRLLARIRNYGHGGTVLISGEARDLRPKYRLRYDRFPGALARLARAKVRRTVASDEVRGSYLERDAHMLPTGLYLDESVSSSDERDAASELEGCIGFIAALSRVDGLIWLDGRLCVKGFGTEITTKQAPRVLQKAKTTAAAPRTLAPFEYDAFGTRHRSIFRYCGRHPEALGFVVSHDGAVRGIMSGAHGVIVWDNLSVLR